MTREDEDRMAQENYAFGPKGKPVTVEQALARAERAESQLALEYARGVEDERKRHMGGVPFVSREEDYRLGYANAVALVVEDLRRMSRTWSGPDAAADRALAVRLANRFERGEHEKKVT